MADSFLEYFYSDKFDSRPLFKNQGRYYTVKAIKELVLAKMNFLADVCLLDLSCFDFMIEVLARIFVSKDIYMEDVNPSFEGRFDDFPKINPDKVFMHFRTSGSSGEKKIVVKTLQNFLNESNDLKSAVPEAVGLEYISTTTPYHLYGFSFHFMLALNSFSIINTDEVSMLEDVCVENSCLVSTPSFFEKMCKYNQCPLISPNLIFSAGARLKDDVFSYVRTLTDKVVEIYGSTETGIIAYRSNETSLLKPFAGISLSLSMESTLVDTKYSYSSPVLINDKIIENGGFIKVLGRTDRVYKIQEKRVDGFEMESFINGIDMIDECYVFKYGEKLACLALLSEVGKDFLYNSGMVELKKVLKSKLNKDFEIVPQRWKFVDEIPKTRSGKVDKLMIEKVFGLNLSIPFVDKKVLGENFAEIRLYFYRNCNFFQGHFDGFPIVPGVVQLYLAKYFSSLVFDVELNTEQYRKLKFSNVIKPDKFIDLKLELLSNGISYKFIEGQSKCSSGILPIK